MVDGGQQLGLQGVFEGGGRAGAGAAGVAAVQVEPLLAGGGVGQSEAGGQRGEVLADSPVSSGLARAATTGARAAEAAAAGVSTGGAGGRGGVTGAGCRV